VSGPRSPRAINNLDGLIDAANGRRTALQKAHRGLDAKTIAVPPALCD